MTRMLSVRQSLPCWQIAGMLLMLLAVPGVRASGQAAPAVHSGRDSGQAMAARATSVQAANEAAATMASGAHTGLPAAARVRADAADNAAVASTVRPGLRDPFRNQESLGVPGVVTKPKDTRPRPPGVRGLLVSQLRLQGIVQEEATHSMIAMVTNASNLSYFVRENQRLYDGVVTRITPSAIYLRPDGPGSAAGAKLQDVVLRIGPAAATGQQTGN